MCSSKRTTFKLGKAEIRSQNSLLGHDSGRRSTGIQEDSTFFMNRLSCLEHLSTLSLSTEMSEMLLQTQQTHTNCKWSTDRSKLINPSSSAVQPMYSCRNTRVPNVGELGSVVVPVDETEQDLKHQQSHLWILG